MNVIWKVARNEFKLILRSFVFRLIAVIVMFVQIVTAYIHYVPRYYQATWGLRAIPSVLPYTSILIYQMVVVLGAVFIATECLDRDLSLDITDSIYSRNFTAPWYMLGKGLGIMMALLGILAIQMLIPLISNMYFLPYTPNEVGGYLIYPLLLTVPSLLFTMGLSWLVMLKTRNQMVTFMVVGIIFGVTFWANRVTGLHHLLDYPGLRIPAMYGDFIGFGDATRLFMQRGIYALLGISLMVGASLFLPRLPQDGQVRRLFACLSVILCITSVVLAVSYIGAYASDRSLRDELRALNHEYGTHPRATMTSCDLNLEHHGDTISVEAVISIRNDSGGSLDSYLFSLNPDLKIESISGPNGELPFERNQHLLTVTPLTSLAPGDTDSLAIVYSGTIDNRITYLDTPESERTDCFNIAFLTVKRMCGIVESDCVVLTPEALWYPVAGVPYGSTFPDLGRKDFPRFTLSVDTESGMVPVSQGLPKSLPDGRTAFRPETPLSQLSLSIAEYQRKATVVDSITFALYMKAGHDFFSSRLENNMEVLLRLLPEYIRVSLENLENQYYVPYPFNYFNVVEVPIQFSAPQRNWTISQENIQPGMMMINERGTYFFDVSNLKSRTIKKDATLPQARGFIDRVFRELYNEPYDLLHERVPTMDSEMPKTLSLSLFVFSFVTDDVFLNIFPNYYSFTNNYHSEQWPIIDSLLERHLALGDDRSKTQFSVNSFSYTDTSNLLLAENSFAEILSSSLSLDLKTIIIRTKLNQLIGALNASIGDKAFDERFKEELIGSRFSSKSFSSLLNSIKEGAAQKTESFLDDWYHSTDRPICILDDVSHVEIHENEQTFYQLMVTLSNPSPTDGVFYLSVNTRHIIQERNTASTEQHERFVNVPARETQCVCIVSDDPFYNDVSINSLVSQNLPAVINKRVPEANVDLCVALHDTVLTVEPIIQPEEQGVIIVDDIDPGCVVTSKHKPTWFQKLFKINTDDREYKPVSFYSLEDRWVRTIDEEFHGDHIRSGLVKKSGSGDQPVTWTAQLPQPGIYDVYAYIPPRVSNASVTIREQEKLKSQRITGTFHYTVHHDGDIDTVEISRPIVYDDDLEWTFLGSYNFSAGEAKVVLSDKSDGQLVFADAIKWVKK